MCFGLLRALKQDLSQSIMLIFLSIQIYTKLNLKGFSGKETSIFVLALTLLCIPDQVLWISVSSDHKLRINILYSSPLDYEAQSNVNYQDHSYTFNVTIVGYNMTSLVVVYVQNINDEPPVFTSSSESTIQDTIGPDRIVMNVKAIDKDGDKVTYRFQGYYEKNLCLKKYIL